MISSATIIGRIHRLMQQNCQDFAAAGSPSPHTAFGLVLDGCGSKYRTDAGTYPSMNEIGANLLGTYAAAFLAGQLAGSRQQTTINNQQLTINSQQFLEKILAHLYRACVTYLNCLIMLHPFANERERTRFIATRLLCTLVGFVVTEETAVCFWSGDGYIGINDHIITLDNENRPDYLAYRVLSGERNGRFNMLTIRDRSNLKRLIAATDGWQSSQIQQLGQPKNSLALQRSMNVQSRERGNFEDDGAIAIYYGE